MNILDCFPEPSEVPPSPDARGFEELLDYRVRTFRGFAEIEAGKSLMRPNASLTMPDGQDMARLMIIRGFEELHEARKAQDENHFLEELIDAFNFFWSAVMFDDKIEPCYLSAPLVRGWERRIPMAEIEPVILGMHWAAGDFMETFRNRAWQNAPQSTYFDGWSTLFGYYEATVVHIGGCFQDWLQFARFFIAKDRVLRFRLKSKY